MKTVENYYNTTLEEDIEIILNNKKTITMYRKLLNSYITKRKLIIKK